MLEAIDLHKYWGQKQALVDLQLSLSKGACLGILGANGSGKTTLLRCLAGELIPEKGAVRLDGQEIQKLTPRKRAQKIGVLVQELEEPPPFTVKELVMLGRYPYQSPWPWDRQEDYQLAERIMKETEVIQFRDQWLAHLSGGEKQRVLLAKLLMQEPEVLLLDEPTNHLDIHHQIALLQMLKQMCKKQNLILIAVLHDLNLAAQFCDQILFLKNGQTIAQGTPAEMIDSVYVQEVFAVEPTIVHHPNFRVPQVMLKLDQ